MITDEKVKIAGAALLEEFKRMGPITWATGDGFEERLARAALQAVDDASLSEDAERWRALMSSQRMHLIGFAGLRFDGPKSESGKTLIHEATVSVEPDTKTLLFGMDFHAWHPAAGDQRYPDAAGRNVLIAYVDHLLAQKARPEGK